MAIAELFSKELRNYQPDASALEHAVRHIPKHIRSKLYHENRWKGSALGHLYQAVIYNRIHKICDNSEEVRSFVKQFDDVPWDKRSRGEISQNGFYYTTEGQIVVRGNGYDLGEFDGLIFGNDGSILFVEMMLTSRDLRNVVDEVSYKRHLLRTLLSREADFLMIVPSDFKRADRLYDLLRDQVTTTGSIPNLPEGLATKAELREPSHVCNKGILLTALAGVSKFDYCQIEARIREAVFKGLSKNGGSISNFSEDQLVKDVILGELEPDAINYLFETKLLTVCDEMLSKQEYWRRLSRAVLVLKLPEGRPKLYLRVRRELEGPNYLKMGPWSPTSFGFEKNLLKKRTAFFNMLESAHEKLDRERTSRIFERYLSDQVAKKRKKSGERAFW